MANTLDGATIQQAQQTSVAYSPSAAQGAGASPDQAKMAGTPAVKRSARLKAERGTQPVVSEQQKAAAASATAAAQGLQVFGSLGSRLSANINKKLSATAAAAQADSGVTLNESEKSLQDEYLKALGDPKAAAAALEKASVTLGVSVEDLKAKFTPKGVASTLTDIYKAATPDKVSLGELFESSTDAAGNVVESPDLVLFAQQTGKTLEEVKAMSAAEADEVFNQLQASAFSKAAGIKAQLEDDRDLLSPYQRETLLNELQVLYSSGAVSAEQLFEDTFQRVQAGQIIKVNGQEVRLEDYLKDEAVTEEIKAALVDSAKLESLLKENPDLGKWVKDNQAALTKILDTSTSAFETVGSAQKDYSDAWADQGLSKALGLLGIKKAGVPTAEERATVTKYQNTLNSFTSQGLSAEWENVSRLLDPTSVKSLLDSADPIATLKTMNQTAGAYGNLPPWLQGTLSGPFDTKAEEWSTAWTKTPNSAKAWFEDPTYGAEVKKLFNTPASLARIDTIEEIKDLESSLFKANAFKSAKTADDWLSLLFEGSVSSSQLVQKVNAAKSNPNNTYNKQFIDRVRQVLGSESFTVKDGKWDINLDGLKKKVQGFIGRFGLGADGSLGYPDGNAYNGMDPKELGLDMRVTSQDEVNARAAQRAQEWNEGFEKGKVDSKAVDSTWSSYEPELQKSAGELLSATTLEGWDKALEGFTSFRNSNKDKEKTVATKLPSVLNLSSDEQTKVKSYTEAYKAGQNKLKDSLKARGMSDATISKYLTDPGLLLQDIQKIFPGKTPGRQAAIDLAKNIQQNNANALEILKKQYQKFKQPTAVTASGSQGNSKTSASGILRKGGVTSMTGVVLPEANKRVDFTK